MAPRTHTLVIAAGIAVLAPLGVAASAVAAPVAHSSSAPGGTIVSALAGTGTSTFGIQPKPLSPTDPRAAFSFGATGGARPKDAVQVDNFSDKPLTLQVYAADAFNTPEGGFDLLPGAKPSKDVGAWIKFTASKPFLTIPARSHLVVDFELDVPANATPGDHAGGIVASLTTPSTDSHGNKVNVEQRVGTRVYARVAGTLTASFAVSGVSAVYHNSLMPFGSGSASIGYTVTNTGNVRLGGKQAVRITSLLGGSVQADALKDIEELLPGNSVKLKTSAHGILPSFMSTARISVDPVAVPGDLDPKLVGVTKTASMGTVPWSGLLVLALIGGAGYWFLRRRRTAKTPSPSAPGRPKPAVRRGGGGRVRASTSESDPTSASASAPVSASAATPARANEPVA